MMPPKCQNLTSYTISQIRRSFHWIFEDNEIDITISSDFIQVASGKNLAACKSFRPTLSTSEGYLHGHEIMYGGLKEWIDKNGFEIPTLFGGKVFFNFVVSEHKDLIKEMESAE